MTHLDVTAAREETGDCEEIQQKSLVRNTPIEESMLEIELAANRTRERLRQEHNEKLKKQMENEEKARQWQHQQALKNFMDMWFGVGEEEYSLLSERAKRQIEELVCAKSRKRFRQKAICFFLFDAALVTGVASFALFVGDIGGTIILGFLCALLGSMPWIELLDGQKIVSLNEKAETKKLIQGDTK